MRKTLRYCICVPFNEHLLHTMANKLLTMGEFNAYSPANLKSNKLKNAFFDTRGLRYRYGQVILISP